MRLEKTIVSNAESPKSGFGAPICLTETCAGSIKHDNNDAMVLMMVMMTKTTAAMMATSTVRATAMAWA